MSNPIEAAVNPQKETAINRAEQEAIKDVERVSVELAAAGYNLRVAAPFPHGGLTRPRYKVAESKYRLFTFLTKCRKPSYSHNMQEPMLADIDPARVETYVQEVKKAAAAEYDAFVAKLSEKIGPCKSASLFGCHVWGFSVLTVVKEDGTTEKWKTQMIINCSSLGKLFHQFPTRKVK
jgi:hypothetical protein